MNSKPDYYQILHVHPEAPREIIKSSYRTLMQRMRMHPDLGGDTDSAAVINEAYAVLMEPERREAYDKSRLAQAANDSGPSREPEAENTQRKTHDQNSRSQTQSADDVCGFCAQPYPAHSERNVQAFCSACDSPRYMTGQLQEDNSDRRAILRVPKHGTVHFCTHWPQSGAFAGNIEDVSLTGMRFGSQLELYSGQVLKVSTPMLRGIATVTRVIPRATPSGSVWEVGVQFLSLHFERSRGAFIADCV